MKRNLEARRTRQGKMYYGKPLGRMPKLDVIEALLPAIVDVQLGRPPLKRLPGYRPQPTDRELRRMILDVWPVVYTKPFWKRVLDSRKREREIAKMQAEALERKTRRAKSAPPTSPADT